MAKTTTANFDTEKNKTSGAKPKTLIEIDTDGGTVYYSDQAIIVPSGDTFLPKIMTWPDRISNQIVPGESVVRTGQMNLVLDNTSRIDANIRPGLKCRLFIWFDGLTDSDKVKMFEGVVSENIGYNLYLLNFTATDIGDLFDKQTGIPLDLATYPNADPDDIGKIQPLLYGDLKNQPCLAIVAGAVSTLLDDISAGASSIELSAASAFPNSGTLIIGNEEDITWSGKSSNTLTGVANVSEDYPRSTRVMEKIAQLEYMVAGHPVKAITNPRILPWGLKVEDAVRIDSGDFAANIDDGGIATVDITEIANVKKAVEIAVTQQQTQVPNPETHDHPAAGNATIPYFFDSVPTAPGTHGNIGRLVNNELVEEAQGLFFDNNTFKVQKSVIEEIDGTMVSAVLKMNAREAAGLVGKVNMKFVFNGVTKINQQKSLNNTLTTFTTSSFSLSGGDWSDFQEADTYIELKRTDGIGGSITIFFGETWLELIYTPSAPDKTLAVDEVNPTIVGGNSVADTLGGILIVDCEGQPDNNPAHYTDVADSLIEEPWDVIHHILENYGNGITDSDIDFDSFQDAEDNLPASYKFAFSIRQKIWMNMLISRLAEQTFCRFVWEAGLAKLNHIKLSGTPIKTIDTDTDTYVSRDGKRHQLQVGTRSLKEIVNDVEVKTNLNYTLGGWDSPDAYNGSTEDSDANSITNFGTQQRTWLMFGIGDNSSMADDIRDKLLEFWKLARKEYTFPTWLKHVELERGDLVGLTTSQLGLADRLCEIIEVDYLPPIPINKRRPELQFKLLDLAVILEELLFTANATITVADIQEYVESLLVSNTTTISIEEIYDQVEILDITATATIAVEDFIVSDDTPWCGSNDDKLYLTSGQFTSTIKDSEDVSGVDAAPTGISYSGANTPWCGTADNKLYLTSGQFTSTIKDSESIGGFESDPGGISWDGTNTPWCGAGLDKLYLQSGQFTSTIKDSEDIGGVDSIVTGISWDGTNTPWCGSEADKLYLQSGQFTSTLKTSESIGGVDNAPRGISWDGTNTPWCGSEADKLYLQSGQFTSTLKTSEDVSGVDAGIGDIDTNRLDLRLGI